MAAAASARGGGGRGFVSLAGDSQAYTFYPTAMVAKEQRDEGLRGSYELCMHNMPEKSEPL